MESATVENVVFASVPIELIAVKQTMIIRANITAYSTAVGPSSDARKRRIFRAKSFIANLSSCTARRRNAFAPPYAGPKSWCLSSRRNPRPPTVDASLLGPTKTRQVKSRPSPRCQSLRCRCYRPPRHTPVCRTGLTNIIPSAARLSNKFREEPAGPFSFAPRPMTAELPLSRTKRRRLFTNRYEASVCTESKCNQNR